MIKYKQRLRKFVILLLFIFVGGLLLQGFYSLYDDIIELLQYYFWYQRIRRMSYGVFGVSFLVCAVIQTAAWLSGVFTSKVTNPTLTSLQRRFFLPLVMISFADWLQAPYLYYLFHNYGFVFQQILVLYAVGAVSAATSAVVAPVLVDHFSHRAVALVSLSCNVAGVLARFSNTYSVLFLSRVLTASSIPVLHAALISHYLSEHNRLDLPADWCLLTVVKSRYLHLVFAPAAGLVCLAGEWYSLPLNTPYLISIAVLCLAYLPVLMWPAGDISATLKLGRLCGDALTEIRESRTVQLLTASLVLSDAAALLLISLWTPLLITTRIVSFAVVFSTIALGRLGGWALGTLLGTGRVHLQRQICLFTLIIFFTAVFICSYTWLWIGSLVALCCLAAAQLPLGVLQSTDIALCQELVPSSCRLGVALSRRFTAAVVMATIIIVHLGRDNVQLRRALVVCCCGLFSVSLFLSLLLSRRVRRLEQLVPTSPAEANWVADWTLETHS